MYIFESFLIILAGFPAIIWLLSSKDFTTMLLAPITVLLPILTGPIIFTPAPTDTLSVIASLGSVGLGLSTAEDKNERYSVLLNVGLPIVGSVATTLYFTARLVSGFKALGLGLLSGFVFGQAGSVVDNLRQKHLQPKTLIAQQSTKESI